MSSSDNVQTLPIAAIQSTFPLVVNEVYSGVISFEDIWVSFYDHSPSDIRRQATSTDSMHAKVRVILDDRDREQVVMQAREGDARMEEAGRNFSVASPSLRIPPTKLLFPVQSYADPERSNTQKPHRITAFALAPDKSQLASGYLDGSILLYPVIPITSSSSEQKYPTTQTNSPPKTTYTSRRQTLISAASASSGVSPALMRAHKSTVTRLQFFPSSRVLLSAGADFTLQIYPAEPTPASAASSGPSQTSTRIPSVRSMTAHTRTVTSTAMIGRGRDIISSSVDGTLRIWDVSSGKEEALVHSASGVGIGVNQISLTAESSSGESSMDGTLYAALNDGAFEVLKLETSQKPYKLVPSFRSQRLPYGALTAIAIAPSTTSLEHVFFAVGTAKGVVCVYNASSYTSIRFRRSDASVEALAFVPISGDIPRLGLAIATADGLPWIASLDMLPSEQAEEKADARVSVYAELAGGDVDAVRAVSVHASESGSGAEVWTASDDGIVRRYVL